ncbi:MAG: DUF3410 domain-containing protein [Myxococcales bacterium]|nr:DUF3410 domain-containing protein [Myxococcales bacterium]
MIRERALDRPDVAAMILDVWDGEPDLAPHRLEDPRLLLASPHVAGYSLEAKIDATAQVHRALASWLGRSPWWTGAELLPTVDLAADGARDLPTLLHQVVDLPGDDARVRALATLDEPARSRAFEVLRRNYRLRREFRSCRVGPAADPAILADAQKIGLITD